MAYELCRVAQHFLFTDLYSLQLVNWLKCGKMVFFPRVYYWYHTTVAPVVLQLLLYRMYYGIFWGKMIFG
jgi:hypothetical protein